MVLEHAQQLLCCCHASMQVHEGLGPDKVTGVIPTALKPVEISGKTYGQIKEVKDMHERKVPHTVAACSMYSYPVVALSTGCEVSSYRRYL